MAQKSKLRVLAAIQSLEEGGRTTRFCDTVTGIEKEGVFILPLCFSNPKHTSKLSNLKIIPRRKGLNWGLIFKIRKVILENKINLIHAHCEFSQLYSGIAGFLCGIKVIGTFHRSDLTKYQPNLVNWVIKILVNQYIAVSNDRKKLLVSNLSFAAENCHVIHGGTQIPSEICHKNKEAIRKKLCLSTDSRIIFSAGHLGFIKGHQDTLKAISLLIASHHDIQLFIAGSGTAQRQEELTQLIQKYGLTQHVHLLGHIENIEEWMSICDFFVQPSIEEAFGLVFIEAGAYGKPCIATNVGGISEIIAHNKTGFLVPPHSPNLIAEKIDYLFNNPEITNAMGIAARQRVEHYFSLKSMVKNYLKVYLL